MDAVEQVPASASVVVSDDSSTPASPAEAVEGQDALGQPAASEDASQAAVYTVQRGDSLSAIAGQYGTTVQALAELNDIDNPNHIFTGQQLRLR